MNAQVLVIALAASIATLAAQTSPTNVTTNATGRSISKMPGTDRVGKSPIDSKHFESHLKIDLGPQSTLWRALRQSSNQTNKVRLDYALFTASESVKVRPSSTENAERFNAEAMRRFRETSERALQRGAIPSSPLYPTRIDTLFLPER